MTVTEAWNVIGSNLSQLYKIRRTKAYEMLRSGVPVTKQSLKGYDDSDLEAETIVFMALKEFEIRQCEKGVK